MTGKLATLLGRDIPDEWPNECCGASSDHDVRAPCVNGRCWELFCGGCGTFLGVSWGSAPGDCDCAARGSWSRPNPAERRKRRMPGGTDYARRYRARKGHR